MLHSLAIAAWRCHHTRLATRNKLIGNTSRTSKLKESAPKQLDALFNEHRVDMLAPPEAVRYLPKAKVKALRKPWGERGSAPHDARSGEQRLHPLSGSPTARPTRL